MIANNNLGGKPHLNYRPDIDGLRAIAVLGVVLFHARLGLSGGFVGVDVFFLISGYLITSIILKDIEAGKFSLISFWDRRVRRIFPALFAVIVVTSIVGWFVLLPTDLGDFGKSVVAQTIFGGNMFFWWNAGYFDTGAASKPLLHTWSLAVEEQYYLLVPLLALFSSTATRKAIGKVLAVVFLLSLPLCIALTSYAPNSAFYLLPARAWELAIGGLLVVLPSARGGRVCQIVGYAGLFMILGAFFMFNEKTAFPGSAALLPTLGTAALIWGNGISSSPNSLIRILSFRPLVFVGSISYSLYLWHWPVLIYSEYLSTSLLHWYVRVLLVIISIALSVFSLRFIETPVRIRKLLPTRRALFGFAAFSVCSYFCLGFFVSQYRGMPSKAKFEAEQYANSRYDFPYTTLVGLSRVERGDLAMLGSDTKAPVHLMVWGDSHAMAIVPVIDDLTHASHSRTAAATYFATAPILEVESTAPDSLKKDSKAWSQAVMQYVRSQRVPNVLLVGRWCTYKRKSLIEGDIPDDYKLGHCLAETVATLEQAGAKVWILKEVPTYTGIMPRILSKAALKGESVETIGMTESQYLVQSQMEDHLLEQAALRGATILDPKPFFINSIGYCKVADAGISLYRDGDHLTGYGARRLRLLFADIWGGEVQKTLNK